MFRETNNKSDRVRPHLVTYNNKSESILLFILGPRIFKYINI